ncbi:MAG TPA: NAD-dependent deacylase [Syntrophorhabdaceae bacterium]|jgi:NAD-dependent deacetylase|nr:NAD-dependent deacylase [Syntrophorhabdaceae bacterium]HOS05953.1 NAD-dependent deacylase [Syntrophorhabdaceae bacterium]HPL41590.1 NAD-dependent deacylase [Syntrophorhabdaceae bacterium]
MINRAIDRLKETRYLLVITGAGISAESGIPTFRGNDGLWQNYRAEELATPWAFKKDPEVVWKWYDWRRGIIGKAEPNNGHLAIKKLEEIIERFFLITQNVDGLHGRTGIKNMIEIHGNLWRVRCDRDGKASMLMDVPLKSIPPLCACGNILRPDVVWFGESMPTEETQKAYNVMSLCDTLMVVGTSGAVYPVASFPQTVKEKGGFVIEINLEPTPISSIADISLFGKSGDILPAIVEGITGQKMF